MNTEDLIWCGYDYIDLMRRYVTNEDILEITSKLKAKPHSFVDLASFKLLRCDEVKAAQILESKDIALALAYETPSGGFLLFYTVCGFSSGPLDLTEAALSKEELAQVESPKIRERGSITDLEKVASGERKVALSYLGYLVDLLKGKADDEVRD